MPGSLSNFDTGDLRGTRQVELMTTEANEAEEEGGLEQRPSAVFQPGPWQRPSGVFQTG